MQEQHQNTCFDANMKAIAGGSSPEEEMSGDNEHTQIRFEEWMQARGDQSADQFMLRVIALIAVYGRATPREIANIRVGDVGRRPTGAYVITTGDGAQSGWSRKTTTVVPIGPAADLLRKYQTMRSSPASLDAPFLLALNRSGTHLLSDEPLGVRRVARACKTVADAIGCKPSPDDRCAAAALWELMPPRPTRQGATVQEPLGSDIPERALAPQVSDIDSEAETASTCSPPRSRSISFSSSSSSSSSASLPGPTNEAVVLGDDDDDDGSDRGTSPRARRRPHEWSSASDDGEPPTKRPRAPDGHPHYGACHSPAPGVEDARGTDAKRADDEQSLRGREGEESWDEFYGNLSIDDGDDNGIYCRWPPGSAKRTRDEASMDVDADDDDVVETPPNKVARSADHRPPSRDDCMRATTVENIRTVMRQIHCLNVSDSDVRSSPRRVDSR